MRPIDARAVDVADVYKGDQLAGHLTRIHEGVSFEYCHDYMAGNNDAVASTLPVREAPYVTGSGAVPAFFAGLLPEGARLNAVVAAVKTSSDDELSLLVAGDRVASMAKAQGFQNIIVAENASDSAMLAALHTIQTA